MLVLGDSSAQGALQKRTFEFRDVLAQPFHYEGLDECAVPLGDVLEQLAKRIRASKGVQVTFEVNEQAFLAEKVEGGSKMKLARPALPPMDAPLSRVVTTILTRLPCESGATYVIRSDYIEITTNAAVRKEFYGSSKRGSLLPLVVASFNKTPLDDALKELAQLTGKNVILDVRIGKEGKARITADFMNVPLDDSVFLLADMANLAAVRINPSTLYVTTPQNAQAIQKRQQEPKAGADDPF